jgi:hypothetical protein
MTESTLTDDDRKAIRTAVFRATALVSLADRGFFDSFKEAFASSKALQNAPAEIKALVVGGFPSLPSAGTTAELGTQATESLKAAAAILAAKAPHLRDGYRDMVLAAVHDVAEAAGGTSAEETAAIDMVRDAFAV